MKRQIFAFAAAVSMAFATSAGSASQMTQTQVNDLDDCQLAYMARCVALGGDWGFCEMQAVSYECPPGT